MNYWDGVSWTEIPRAALSGTYGGTAQVIWPAVTERDGLGRPCGAYGRPEIVIRTAWLTETGMAFWRAQFANLTDASADFRISIWDARNGAETTYEGQLLWPEYSTVSVGATAGQTIYHDVKITIVDCQELT